jgi:hypothetical protein
VRFKQGANGKGDPNSITYIVGNKKDEFGYEIGFASCDPAHHTGGVAFGVDGTLLAASGDGAG